MSGLVLASKSAARRALLAGAGLRFDVAGSGVDEDALKAAALARGADAREIAADLADAKALAVSRGRPGLVIGADQTLELDGRLVDKAADRAEARARLLAMRGRPHALHSAAALARDGEVVWRILDTAVMTVRAFDEAWLDGYLDRGGPELLDCVGCYQLEGEGVQLFEAVRGDYFTVLGLPLLPLLAALRDQGVLAS